MAGLGPVTDSTTNKTDAHSLSRRILIITGAVVGVLALAVGLVLGVGGAFAFSRNYEAPWAADYHKQFADPREQLVAHGLLASSGHNMQPWLIELANDPNVFLLYADPSRLSVAVDPFARQVMVSQGTFLDYVEVAGAQLGYPVTIELFPDGEYDETDLAASMTSTPVARVTLATAAARSQPTYDSLFLSDTNRAPYGPTPLTDEQLAALAGLTAAPASLAILTSAVDRDALGAFGIAGSTIESESAAATAESNAVFRPNELAKNNQPWGFSIEGQGTSGIMKYFLQGLITLLPFTNSDEIGAQRQIDLTTAAVAATPAYGIIMTPSNTRTEQVLAGMLYSRFELTARSQGLVMQPLSQVIQEYPEMAEQYAAVHAAYAPDGETIQMIVRLGTATVDYPTSMRRAVEDFILQ